MQTWMVYGGNALYVLRRLPGSSIHMAVGSPPYFGGLRDYLGNVEQLGHEPHPRLYALALADICDEVRRVLRDDGTFWLNLGDSYVGSGGAGGDYNDGGLKAGQDRFPGSRRIMGAFSWPDPLADWAKRLGTTVPTLTAELITAGWSPPADLKAKDLGGAPWEAAFELRQRGWWLRCDVIWHKKNPRPGGGHLDRPTIDHEYVFQLAKTAKPYYDSYAVRVPAKSTHLRDLVTGGRTAPVPTSNERWPSEGTMARWKEHDAELRRRPVAAATRNRRSVWVSGVSGFRGMHFATFSPGLVEPMIQASSSEAGVCAECGAPWRRLEARLRPSTFTEMKERVGFTTDSLLDSNAARGRPQDKNAVTEQGTTPHLAPKQAITVGWTRSCACFAGRPVPALVLDPFAGAGSAGIAALKLGRSFVGVELNMPYVTMISDRLAADYPNIRGQVVPLA